MPLGLGYMNLSGFNGTITFPTELNSHNQYDTNISFGNNSFYGIISICYNYNLALLKLNETDYHEHNIFINGTLNWHNGSVWKISLLSRSFNVTIDSPTNLILYNYSKGWNQITLNNVYVEYIQGEFPNISKSQLSFSRSVQYSFFNSMYYNILSIYNYFVPVNISVSPTQTNIMVSGFNHGKITLLSSNDISNELQCIAPFYINGFVLNSNISNTTEMPAISLDSINNFVMFENASIVVKGLIVPPFNASIFLIMSNRGITQESFNYFLITMQMVYQYNTFMQSVPSTGTFTTFTVNKTLSNPIVLEPSQFKIVKENILIPAADIITFLYYYTSQTNEVPQLSVQILLQFHIAGTHSYYSILLWYVMNNQMVQENS